MASSMPKFPALPETKEEIDAFFKKVDENDAKEVKLELYFTQAEVDHMCDFEKKRVSNLKRNYDMMKQLGLPVDKPLFMQKNKRKQDEYSSSSDSDKEWTPALERPKPKSRGPVKSIWVTPTKKPPKKEKVETVTVPQEEAVDESELDFDGFGTDEKCSSVDDIKTIKPDRRKLANNIKKDKIDMEEMVLDYPADFDQFDVEAAEQKGKKPKKVAAAVIQNRYPKRSIPVTNYADIEVPDDDHFLFCDDCHDEYLGDCPVHGPLKIVEDSKSEEGSPDHAEKSAPPGLVVKESQIPDAGSGVWSIEPMEKGARLGPYKGETVKSEDKAHVSGYSWQVYGQNDKNHHFIDAGDTSTSNWMRFVNCARNEEEQNVLAYQYKGQIYYRTIKPVEKDMEMLVWYGDEYGRELGIKVASPQHVHRLLSFLHQSTRNHSSDTTPFWKLHGRRIEVPESEWKPLIHHDKGFPCDVCGVAFVKEEYMQQHRKNRHLELYRTGQKKHQCEQCSYSTDNVGHLASHMLTHTGEKPFTCQECGKGFTTAGNLNTHKVIHSGEQPYQCTVCEKRFNQSSVLSRHMDTHNTKLFQCTVCDKSFTRNDHLKRHMKIHTGVLDFECSHCDYKTNAASNLKKHVILHHTHDYPHHCPVCDKGFVVPLEMRKHIDHNHKS